MAGAVQNRVPQALAVSLPNLSNSVIGMLHGSTLAFTVSVVDINAQAQIVASTNWKFFESYLAAAIFWGLTLLIERLTAIIEKRINLYNRGASHDSSDRNFKVIRQERGAEID